MQPTTRLTTAYEVAIGESDDAPDQLRALLSSVAPDGSRQIALFMVTPHATQEQRLDRLEELLVQIKEMILEKEGGQLRGYALGIKVGLPDLIDWERVLSLPRDEAGHILMMSSIFLPPSEIVGWHFDGTSEGQVAAAYQFGTGAVAVVTDFYGSCAGCDVWAGADDNDARKIVLDLVHNARVFSGRDEAKLWCKDLDPDREPEHYPFKAASQMKWVS